MCGGGPFCGNAVNSVTESASPVTLNVYRSPSNQMDRPSPFVRATSCVFILLKFRTRSRTIFDLEALLNTSEYLEAGSRRARISRGKHDYGSPSRSALARSGRVESWRGGNRSCSVSRSALKPERRVSRLCSDERERSSRGRHNRGQLRTACCSNEGDKGRI